MHGSPSPDAYLHCWPLPFLSPCLQVTVPLTCGHIVTTPCRDEAALTTQIASGNYVCREPVELTLSCGHRLTVKCHDREELGSHVCKEKCGMKVEACGHPCTGVCSSVHAHSCAYECRVMLICGHQCQAGCGRSHTSICRAPCGLRCAHNKACPRSCGQLCVRCVEPCYFGSRHSRCTKRCSEPCDRLPCNMRWVSRR